MKILGNYQDSLQSHISHYTTPGKGGHMTRQKTSNIVGSSKQNQKKSCFPSATVMMALAWILALAVGITGAQTLDTAILGIVSDPSGALVSGAAVTITQPATGNSHSVTTGQDGKYEVRYLLPGEYTVEVKA